MGTWGPDAMRMYSEGEIMRDSLHGKWFILENGNWRLMTDEEIAQARKEGKIP